MQFWTFRVNSWGHAEPTFVPRKLIVRLNLLQIFLSYQKGFKAKRSPHLFTPDKTGLHDFTPKLRNYPVILRHALRKNIHERTFYGPIKRRNTICNITMFFFSFWTVSTSTCSTLINNFLIECNNRKFRIKAKIPWFRIFTVRISTFLIISGQRIGFGVPMPYAISNDTSVRREIPHWRYANPHLRQGE